MKTIDTLIEDINEVLLGKGGWDAAITEYFAEWVSTIAEERFSQEPEPRAYLSLSQLGTPCERKLWYKVNESQKAEPFTPETLGKFFYGDLLEALVLSLAKAAGHQVDGLQEELNVYGVKGHGDAIIDGRVIDVKSASRFGFQKFKQNKLKEDDPFGYISQLSSYLYAYQDDPRVTDKTTGSFLVVNKESFKLALDTYDLSEELKNKEQEVRHLVEMVRGDCPPRTFGDIPDGNSGNRKLEVTCGYCEFKQHCWPKLRAFAYSGGPRFLTEIKKVPMNSKGPIKEIKLE